MRILFLRANNKNWRQLVHPLGLMQLSAYIKERRPGRDEIRILDSKARVLREPELERKIREFSPDVIGISSVVNELESTHGFASSAKKAAPAAKVVLGGSYASAYPEVGLADTNIDCAVIGEGELTFVELLGALEKGVWELEKIKGLAFMKGGALQRTPPREFIEDLDTLPFPDWDAIDLSDYPGRRRMSVLNNDNWMSLFTSRGCPYRCIFCHKIFGKRFRARSAEKVVEEITILHDKYGVKEFDVIDDIFNCDKARTEKICDLLAQKDYKISLGFAYGLRVDALDENLITKLKKAGTKNINFPVESVEPRIQRVSGKNLDVANISRLIDHAVDLGIFCTGVFMLGLPTETPEEMENSIRFAERSRLHSAEFAIPAPFKGTALWDMTRVSGAGGREDDSFNYTYFRRNVNPALEKLHRSAYLRFYGSPGRIFRVLKAYFSISPPSALFWRLASVFRHLTQYDPSAARKLKGPPINIRKM